MLGKNPGRTQYNAAVYNDIWKKIILRVKEKVNDVDGIHDLITELCPWYSSPAQDKKWTLSHIENLIADTTC